MHKQNKMYSFLRGDQNAIAIKKMVGKKVANTQIPSEGLSFGWDFTIAEQKARAMNIVS